MADRIVVINPNSTQAVTDAMDRACSSLRMTGGPAIECVTLTAGPPGIESQYDADSVVMPLCELALSRGNDAGAFIVACYSDPGLYALRDRTDKPVLGIAECGTLTAMTLGDRFGVIAILQSSLARQRRYVRAMGVADRFAGNRSVGLGVTELSDEARTFERMIRAGEALRDEDGADVVIMGCGGMARYRDRLADRLGIPVVEPTVAAVSMAIGRVRRGW